MNEHLFLKTADRVRLAATLHRPAGAPSGSVSIQAAVGVKRGFYARFADYLAERGLLVLTYDYRGIGDSRGVVDGAPAPLRGHPARIRDWATRDIPSALLTLNALAPHLPMFLVGHSFGGQASGLVPHPERIRAAFLVGAQSGYWKHWRGIERAGMWFFTHALIPGMTRLYGYAPAARIGMGEDLPAQVALEWVRWCRDPEYLVGDLGAHESFARIRMPIRILSPTDDRYAPQRAVEALLRLFPNAQGYVRRVSPADVDQRAIGHFGFFREAMRDTLWREAADWLLAHIGTRTPASR